MKPLLQELDAWKDAGNTAEFWWRDDDAAEPSVALDKLISMSNSRDIPCGLATVPAKAGEPLRKAVSNAVHVWILQHGWAHINHATTKGHGAWELGNHRPISVVVNELRDGMVKLSQLFKMQFVPALVPPWNRISSELLPYLPVMGYRGLSGSYGKDRPMPPADLIRADAHCDVLYWKDKPKVRFVGTDKAVNRLVEHLEDKRTGKADPAEPTCILTHHMVMDADAWDFVDQVFQLTHEHEAARWVSPADIWPAKG